MTGKAAKTTVRVALINSAAKDDYYQDLAWLAEDGLLEGRLSVLANDPGSAKLIGVSQTAPSATDQMVNGGASFRPQGFTGNLIVDIDPATGELIVDATALDPELQSLGEGQTTEISFYYTAQMANGVYSTAKVTISIDGTNDDPVFTTASELVGMLTDTAADDTFATLTGTVKVSDVDKNDTTLTISLADGETGGSEYGTFSIDADGTWRFVPDQSAVEGLKSEEILTFGIKVADAHGGASTKTVTITLKGANDTAEITGTADGGTLIEDSGSYQTSGVLSVADRDQGDTGFQDVDPAKLAGTYGDFTFDKATGAWAYTLRNGDAAVQALGGGAVVYDTLDVTSADGTATETITVEVKGTNGAATITGSKAGSLTEDSGTTLASGTLSVTDEDSDENAFQDVPTAALSGTYGDWTFDATTGAWTYALRNGDANVQALGAGDIVHDKLTVKSLDGTATETIKVEVKGTNGAATITGSKAGNLTEDSGTTLASGTLSVTDEDSGENAFQDVPTAALLGTYGDWNFDATSGAWTYALRNGDANVQALGAGEIVHDELTVKSLDGTATETIKVEVKGTNGAATITGSKAGNLTEDSGTTLASGTLSVTDEDSLENAFQDVPTAALSGTYGDWNFDATSGAWTYALRNGDANVQALGAGDSAYDELTVKSLDGTATETIKVEVKGTNGAATITGSKAGNLTEDSGTTLASGTLSVTDEDSDENAFQDVPTAALSGTYGDWTFDATTGAWTYALRNGDANVQALGAGDSLYEELTVKSLDGTATETIKVEVKGTNGAATISGDKAAAVTEDSGSYTRSGTLSVSDEDSGEAKFQGLSGAQLIGTYGDWTFNAQTSAWTYELRNGDANVQALLTGQAVYDDLLVTSADGSKSETIRVTVSGLNEVVAPPAYTSPPVFTGTGDPNDRDGSATSTVTSQTIGNAGNENWYGTAGSDTINAGAGNDYIYSAGGADTVIAGPETTQGGDSDDVYAGSGADTVYGGDSTDKIWGGSGDDRIFGGLNADTITGGYGADILTGGAGSDTFVYLDAKDTGDTILDFGSGDKIDLKAFAPSTWVGLLAAPGQVGANQVGYMIADGTTTVYVDTDGVAGADLEIKLTGSINLGANDFIFA